MQSQGKSTVGGTRHTKVEGVEESWLGAETGSQFTQVLGLVLVWVWVWVSSPLLFASSKSSWSLAVTCEISKTRGSRLVLVLVSLAESLPASLSLTGHSLRSLTPLAPLHAQWKKAACPKGTKCELWTAKTPKVPPHLLMCAARGADMGGEAGRVTTVLIPILGLACD